MESSNVSHSSIYMGLVRSSRTSEICAKTNLTQAECQEFWLDSGNGTHREFFWMNQTMWWKLMMSYSSRKILHS